jgi:hypothetical protein
VIETPALLSGSSIADPLETLVWCDTAEDLRSLDVSN